MWVRRWHPWWHGQDHRTRAAIYVRISKDIRDGAGGWPDRNASAGGSPRNAGTRWLSLWETRKNADAAVPVATSWVHENLGEKVELRSNVIGDMAFFEGIPATV